MTDQHPENNQILHELFRKCWHEFSSDTGNCRCGIFYRSDFAGNPSYAADPRLVLEGMREAGKEVEFIDYLFKRLFLGKPEWISYDAVYRIVELIRDKTGRMRDLAIEFFKQEGK